MNGSRRDRGDRYTASLPPTLKPPQRRSDGLRSTLWATSLRAQVDVGWRRLRGVPCGHAARPAANLWSIPQALPTWNPAND